MDPDKCLREMLHACAEASYGTLPEERQRAYSLAIDRATELSEWLANEGSEPDWRSCAWQMLDDMAET